jgi:hypothetical protein
MKKDPIALVEKDFEPTDLKKIKGLVKKEIDIVVEKALQASFANNNT